MNYNQGIENAVANLWDLLCKYDKTEAIPKEAIRELIKELEKDL